MTDFIFKIRVAFILSSSFFQFLNLIIYQVFIFLCAEGFVNCGMTFDNLQQQY